MKKSCLLAAFLMLALVCNASAYINTPSLEVDLTSQNPDTARPGEPVEIVLSVQNNGNSDLEDITIEIEPEYPFSEITGESLSKEIAYLDARQDEDDAVTLKFRLMTDSSAAAGTYEIDIRATVTNEDGDSYTTTRTVELEVHGKEYAQIVTINKASINPGSEEPLEFIVTNTGNSALKNMVISWEDPEGVILPVYSDNTKYINYLDAGESIDVSYTIMADVNADPALYTLNINLEFEDYDTSSVSTIQTTAGLFVGGETDFDVSFSESDSGTVSLSLANVGNNQAYSIKVSIPEQDNFAVSGSSSTIVGNLEKGDYTIASFDLMSSASGPSSMSGEEEGVAWAAEEIGMQDMNSQNNILQVVIEYTDSIGTRHSVTKEVEIDLMSSSGTMGDMPTGGPGGNSDSSLLSNRYLIGAVVLLLIGGVVYYRKEKELPFNRIKMYLKKEKPENKD
ncbi:hypothetical protein J2755_000005 [Methanohalophilus levihalophilus]|uniref:COG1361 S-layer family protein n=1 Tax=Methanohalophilus levihalophilus TaxID=1431282 RepID=UPI001AE40480|nr:COG1361 S-layer family protein [Methanohalophilus levihalophilus]MBP2029085.1 hypothetical protein [Methanohalophilus levihalophilus]